MKVFYDHQAFSLQDAGGISRYFYELARYIAQKEGVEAEIAIGMNRSVQLLSKLRSDGVVLDTCPGGLQPGKVRYLCNELFCNAVALANGLMDIYHPTLYRRMPLVQARSMVATQHDCIHELFPQLYPRVEDVIRANRNLFEQADAIICVSESTQRDLLSFYPVDRAKTRVIYHGLNLLPRCEEAASKLSLLVRREYLLFVGSRASYKNFDSLLIAFRNTGLYRVFDLLVLGGGALTTAEIDLASRLEITNCIRCVPHCADTLLAEAYAGAKLFAYPSLYEGFGFPPLEAMSLGCPVLVCNSSSLPEVCLDAPFFFEPNDQSSLEGSLLEAVSDEGRRSRSVERGREVSAAYKWKKCGEHTLSLYRECL